MKKKICILLTAGLLCVASAFTEVVTCPHCGKAFDTSYGTAKIPQVPQNSATDFKYDLNETEDGIVLKKYIGSSDTIVIPSEIEGYPVVEIGENFMNTFDEWKFMQYWQYLKESMYTSPNYRITSVWISNSVTKIDKYAFYACKNLTSVCLPPSLAEVGSNAFNNCEKLTNIELQVPTQKIEFEGDYVFSGTALSLKSKKTLKDAGYAGNF